MPRLRLNLERPLWVEKRRSLTDPFRTSRDSRWSPGSGHTAPHCVWCEGPKHFASRNASSIKNAPSH